MQRSSGIFLLLILFVLSACSSGTDSAPANNYETEADLPRVAAQSFGFTSEGFLFAGAVDAPVTVYEVFNANCPGCAKHHTTALSQLVAQYGDTGQVKFVLVDLPLSPDWGEDAHFTAYCIGQQKGAAAQWAFWQRFYDHLGRWYQEGPIFTTELALNAGANLSELEDCINSSARDSVFALQAYAEEHLLPERWSTPFFRLEDGQGRRLNALTGSPPLTGWQRELDRHLG